MTKPHKTNNLNSNLYTFLTSEMWEIITEYHLIIVSNGISKILQILCQTSPGERHVTTKHSDNTCNDVYTFIKPKATV